MDTVVKLFENITRLMENVVKSQNMEHLPKYHRVEIFQV